MNTNEAGKVEISPLPWKVARVQDWVYGLDGQAIASCQFRKAGKHNAAFIVQCANERATLLAIAEAAKEAISVLERAACGDCGVNHQNQAACANHEIRQALAAYTNLKENV